VNSPVVTRKPGEAIRIGEDIEVTILGVKGNQFRIGVTAPKNVPVHRDEVYQRIREEEFA